MSKRLRAGRLERIDKDIEKWILNKQNNDIVFGRIVKKKKNVKKRR